MTEQIQKHLLLVKLLKMTMSSNDGEALVAVRKANKLLAEAGWDWDRVMAGKITVVGDPFAGLARPAPPQAPQQRQTPSSQPSMPQAGTQTGRWSSRQASPQPGNPFQGPKAQAAYAATQKPSPYRSAPQPQPVRRAKATPNSLDDLGL